MDQNAPDLSYLTDDERKIIEAVIDRQRAEEKSMIVEEKFCELCEKTKFVDDCRWRECSICRRKCCSSCVVRWGKENFLCDGCLEKDDRFCSSKQFSSDYILNKIVSKDDELRPKKVLRDFRFHSLDERDSNGENNLKDSGIDTASSSTILNVFSASPRRKTRFDEENCSIFQIELENCADGILENFPFRIETRKTDENQFRTEIVELKENSANLLRCEDEILEWNDENVEFASPEQFRRVVERNSRRTKPIRVLIRRTIRSDRKEKRPIELELGFERENGSFQLIIYGAKNLLFRRAEFFCRISLSGSKEEKFTKTQLCLSDQCLWNESIRFDDERNLPLSIELFQVEQEKTLIGRLSISSFGANFHRRNFIVENLRKRRLPSIPTREIEIHREKVSQELLEKATQLKIRLHFHSNQNQTGWLKQKTFDESTLKNERKSLIHLPKSNSREKNRLPIIRDRTTSNPNLKIFKNRRDTLETTTDEIDSDGSELSSGISTNFPRSSLKPAPVLLHQTNQVQLSDEEIRQMTMRSHETSTPNVPVQQIEQQEIKLEKTIQRQDGSLSDSALTNQNDPIRKRRPSMSYKALVILGVSKKANSASNLGLNKRHGFQRSEEIGVQPHLRNRTLERQTSKENEKPTPKSAPIDVNRSTQSPFALSHQREQSQSIPDNMKLWSGALRLPHERPFAEFIQGLGAGQVVSRQVLASPCHGEIQIGLHDQQGMLGVEIVRARNLLQKAFYVTPPAPFVKVYLLNGKTCLEKYRTRTSRRTLDPLIQQSFLFKEYSRAKILQISVWGDYGKLDRRVFMGVCQINFEDLTLNGSQQILDWYKLFSANSLMNAFSIGDGNSSNRSNVTRNIHQS